MSVTRDTVALNEYVVCGWPDQVLIGHAYRTRIFGQEIEVRRHGAEEFKIFERRADGSLGRELPVDVRYHCIFTTLGTPTRPIPQVREFNEEGRRLVSCGSVGVNTSPYRVVENFLDLAHFPFIHTGTLGGHEHTEVVAYKVEHRKDVDEIWTQGTQFFQPRGSRATEDGFVTNYIYRVLSPFSAMFYKSNTAGSQDALCLFVQPLDETECRAYTPMALVDNEGDMTSLIDFQQSIFLQDRMILENQRPALLPLDPAAETPTRADSSSVAYRRWLKGMGMQFGILEKKAV